VTLDAGYLEYPKRQRGMDHGIYPWSNLFARAPIRWPAGKEVAVWIVVDLEWFPIMPSDTPFRAPGHMQTTYPDYRHYTARDYGSRIGVYRLLDAFAKSGVTACFAANAAVAERYPSLVADIIASGHEIIAHSYDMNGTVATGVSEDEERALIAQSLNVLESACGSRPRGWLSLARSQSWNTLQLLAEAGLSYQCDWVNDDLPYVMTTPAGRIVNMPLNHELSDRQIIIIQQQSADSYVGQVQDAYHWLGGEAESGGGRVLPLNVTPYIMGLPYRIGAFERSLAWLGDQHGCWFARGDQIVEALQIR